MNVKVEKIGLSAHYALYVFLSKEELKDMLAKAPQSPYMLHSGEFFDTNGFHVVKSCVMISAALAGKKQTVHSD